MIKHLSITQKGKLLAHQAATTANCPPRCPKLQSLITRNFEKRHYRTTCGSDRRSDRYPMSFGGSAIASDYFPKFPTQTNNSCDTHSPGCWNACILAGINSGGELMRAPVHSRLHADKPELYIVIFSLVFSRY